MKRYTAWALGFAAVFLAAAISVALVAVHRGRKRANETNALSRKDTALCGILGEEDCLQDERCVWLQARCENAHPGTETVTSSETGAEKPSSAPSVTPSMTPTGNPSTVPSLMPTLSPTGAPTTKQPTKEPTKEPTSIPTATPYYPGDLTTIRRDADGRRVTISTGMEGRAIAYSGWRVAYTSSYGGQSSLVFHNRPDGAGVFPSSSDDGGFFYVSNSEVDANSGGGVYVLEFDGNGEVVRYYRTLTSSNNCGGGKTPWNTWISCEENGDRGYVYQTDPWGEKTSQLTFVVPEGGNYESFAYDVRDSSSPRFFVTEDSVDGPMVRFTPDATAMACFNSPKDSDKWCTLDSGSHSYLRLNSSGSSGTFTWVTNKNSANPNLYPNAEGIDVVDGTLFFVSKIDRTLFELDLDALTFTRTSTVSGAFNLQPDQLKAIVNDPNELVYFCEDGGPACDIHGRNSEGEYFTIVEGTDYNTETTGLGFSPDAKYMFVAFQEPGVIWQFWRSDGLPFTGNIVDIKYHAEQARRRLGGRF